MGNRGWRPGATVLIWVLVSACRPEPALPSRPQVPVAVVNGEAIDLNDFNLRFQRSWTQTQAGEEPPLEVKLYYLRGEIEECLVVQEAKRLGLLLSEAEFEKAFQEIRKDYSDQDFAQLLIDEYIDLEEWKESLRRQLLIQKVTDQALDDRIEISAGQVADYYQAHAEAFSQPAQVHARQAVLVSLEEAQAFRRKVLGGEDFSALAQTQSQGPEAEKGGDLNWLSPGQILRPLDQVLFALPTGKLSDPVRTDYGVHVLQVLERREARTPALAEVEPMIRKQLRDQERERLYRKWIQELMLRAKIRINYPLL